MEQYLNNMELLLSFEKRPKKEVKLATARLLRVDPVEFWKLVDWFGLTPLELETVKANVTVWRWQCPAAESKKQYQIFTAELFKKKDLRIFAGLTRLMTDLREEKAQEMMEKQNK